MYHTYHQNSVWGSYIVPHHQHNSQCEHIACASLLDTFLQWNIVTCKWWSSVIWIIHVICVSWMKELIWRLLYRYIVWWPHDNAVLHNYIWYFDIVIPANKNMFLKRLKNVCVSLQNVLIKPLLNIYLWTLENVYKTRNVLSKLFIRRIICIHKTC